MSNEYNKTFNQNTNPISFSQKEIFEALNLPLGNTFTRNQAIQLNSLLRKVMGLHYPRELQEHQSKFRKELLDCLSTSLRELNNQKSNLESPSDNLSLEFIDYIDIYDRILKLIQTEIDYVENIKSLHKNNPHLKVR